MAEKAKKPKPQKIAADKRREFSIVERRREAVRLWLERRPGKKPRSVREVGQILGVSHQTVCNDIDAELASIHEDAVINVRREFLEQLKFAKKLRIAAEEYLSDPNDPLNLIIAPRADEIEVVYYDFGDKTQRGEPKKKTATLHALLAKVEGIETDKISIRHVDLRKFALDAIGTVDVVIDKFAKLGGDYTKDKNNPADSLAIARQVIEDAVAKGMERAEAVKRASERYGILEETLLDA